MINVYMNKFGDLMLAWPKTEPFNYNTYVHGSGWLFMTEDTNEPGRDIRETNLSPQEWGWEYLGPFDGDLIYEHEIVDLTTEARVS